MWAAWRAIAPMSHGHSPPCVVRMSDFSCLIVRARLVVTALVLLVSHQLNLVARFADRVLLLSQGQVVADGAPTDVRRGETLERVYEWPLVVTRDPAVGAPTLVPLRKRRSPIT